MMWLRSAVFTLGYAVLTFFYGVIGVLLLATPVKFRSAVIVSWTKLVIPWLRLTCGIRYRVKGEENLVGLQSSFVVLSKHQSTWETLFLQGYFSPASTVLKKQLLRIPFFGWGLAALNPIPIDRDNPRDALRKVKTQGIERLNSGFNLILFPEGTRTPLGQVAKYARSGADIAIAANKSIIPVAVNAGKCWVPGQFVKQPGLVTVSFGPAIGSSTADGKNKNSKELMEEVRRWIETEMQSLDSQ